jgi:lipopolysaccharide biosynthesis protein
MEVGPPRDFIPSPIGHYLRARRIKVFVQGATMSPSFEVVRAARRSGKWALYFIYTPTGQIFDQHVFTLRRLKETGFQVLVIVGSNNMVRQLPDALRSADAVIMKQERGFDFSGYTIGLNYLVKQFCEVDVLVLNDSVFGPFVDLMPLVNQARWTLTGFTSSHAVENHIQTYAFILRAMNEKSLASLKSVFFRHVAMSYHGAVAFLQETRLARKASVVGSVGALWNPIEPSTDLTMAMPIELVRSGFPFLKRSVLGKFASDFSQEEMLGLLSEKGHPIVSKTLFAGSQYLTLR